MPHPFLSPEWMTAARAIREKHADAAPEVETVLRINVAVTDVPFDSDTVEAYIDTSSGRLEMELGSLDEPDATITTDYETAKIIFVEQDQTVVMQSFMNGTIKIQGDMMKLMGLQTAMPTSGESDTAEAIAQEIKDITE